MRKNLNTYYLLTRKTLHVTLALLFCLGFMPSGADAKVTCDEMRCNHGEPQALQHSQLGASNKSPHGCCSGSPEDPCNLDTKDKKDPRNWAVECCRIQSSRSPYYAFAGIDTSAQDRIIKGLGLGFQFSNRTELTSIYLQTLSLRC